MAAGSAAVDESILVGVSVPATAANLGPGYDSFGIALDVPLVAVAGHPRDVRVTTSGEGEGELEEGDDNLVWQGVLAWCAHAGVDAPDVSVHVRSAIPLQRGMGSSSAAAVAGLVLGRALVGGHATSTQLLALATELEGHPDNAAAAIAGGLVACTPDGRMTRVPPSEALRPVAIIPTGRQSTAEARTVLPEQVSLAAAAANGARAARTFAGLAGLLPLDARDVVDVLHEPPRLARTPGTRAVVEALRAEGVPAVLSGSGPTALAIVPAHDDAAVEAVRRTTATALGEVGEDPAEVEVRALRWDLAGAVMCPPDGRPAAG